MGFWSWLSGSSSTTTSASPPLTGAGSTLPQVSDTISGIPITPGDTLSELGRDYGFDWNTSQIVRNGRIVPVNPDQVQVGDVIIPQTHTIQPGDTLSEIARDNNFDYNNAQIIRNGRVYEIGKNGVPADQIQPGDQIAPKSAPASVTESAEATAEEQGSDSKPEQTTQNCSGWIAVRSHYVNFNLIAVGGRVTISRLEGGQATQVLQEEIEYTAIAQNGLFVSRRPVARSDSNSEDTTQQNAAETETAETPISQAQPAEVAAENGNPLVLFGGDEGLPAGNYRVTFRPNVRHGKLRIDPSPISGESEEMNGRYKIIPAEVTINGLEAIEWTTANTTNEYLQVPSDTTVNEEWSQDVQVACRSQNQPTIVEFQWTDFKTANTRTENNLRTLHPSARHTFFAFINKNEEQTGVSYTVTDSYRSPQEQDDIYCQDFRMPRNGKPQTAKFNYCIAKGYTNGRGPWASNAKQWQSNHNYGIAVDMYDLSSGALESVNQAGGSVASHFGLNWGQSFGDTPHFEMVTPAWRDLRDRRENHTFTYEGRSYVSFP